MKAEEGLPNSTRDEFSWASESEAVSFVSREFWDVPSLTESH